MRARAGASIQRWLSQAPSLNVGRYLVAVLAGGWLALLPAALLGGLRADVAGSVAALSLVLALLFIASWDLLVRWGLLKSRPLQVGSPPQTGVGRWLRYVGPWTVLLAGIVIGHVVWR